MPRLMWWQRTEPRRSERDWMIRLLRIKSALEDMGYEFDRMEVL